MGFAKCSYRNCTVKSNKENTIHLFHYPVFDKVRCHQWLTNARKLEYLNLKVSQLRNRVICQYHFSDDNFMNYLKNKLRHDAVPTLNGSYCDADPNTDNEISDQINTSKLILEDIEQEVFTRRNKVESYSKLYGDFLTNSEVDINYSYAPIKVEVDDLQRQYMEALAKVRKKIENKTKQVKKPSQVKPKRQIRDTKSKPVVENQTFKGGIKIISEKTVCEPVRITGEYLPVSPRSFVINPKSKQSKDGDEPQQDTQLILHNYNEYDVVIANKDTASIILDNNMPVEPIDQPEVNSQILPEQLEVNAQVLLNKIEESKSEQSLKDKYDKIIIELSPMYNELACKKLQLTHTTELQPTHTTELQPIHTTEPSTPVKVQNAVNKTYKQKQDSVSMNKTLLKRNLIRNKTKEPGNDILAEALKKSKVTVPSIPVQRKTQVITKEKETEKVASLYCEDSALSQMQENIINYMDSRLNIMQNILSLRIDQNTQKLNELKNASSISKSERPTKKSVGSQVTKTEESHKVQLYEEISKFLSSDAKSLIYEELFINPHVQKSTKEERSSGIAKKRRRKH